MSYLYIFIGGGIGAVLRYLMQTIFVGIAPYNTFIVNIIGSFAIGYLASWFYRNEVAWANISQANLKLLLVVGLLGGFTTFSAFSFETFELMAQSKVAQTAIYIVGSVIAAITATYIGWFVAK